MLHLALSFAAAAALAPLPAQQGAPDWVPPVARGPGLVHHVYASAATGTDVGYHVWLPPDYLDATERRYPVVYWLHGSGGGAAGLALVARRWDDAVTRGLVPPAIVVFPNGLPNGMWCDSVDGRTPVETVLVREIVPRIDALFRTIARREARIVEGFSMGGYGALRLAFAHRDVFGAASSLGGGPLQRELVATPRANEARRLQVMRRVYGGDMAEFVRRSPWQLAIEHHEALTALPLRLAIGTADETLPANRALHEHLLQLGIAHEYVEAAGVPHQPQQLLETLGDGYLAFHRRVLAAVPAR